MTRRPPSRRRSAPTSEEVGDPTLYRGRRTPDLSAAERHAMSADEARELNDAEWAAMGARRGLTGPEARARYTVTDRGAS